jgi:hypothetical protein
MSMSGPIRWVKQPYIPEGKVALLRDGKLVWYGNLSDPFDDADMDEMHLNPADWKALARTLAEKSP